MSRVRGDGPGARLTQAAQPKARGSRPAAISPKQPAKQPATSGSWKPGQSGNPTGRPAVVKEVRDLARQYTREAVLTLVSVMRDRGQPGAARVAAASQILDRGYGKPAQTIAAAHFVTTLDETLRRRAGMGAAIDDLARRGLLIDAEDEA